MILRRACGIALVLGVLACSPALDWRDAAPDGATLRALLPCKPERVVRTVPLGGVPTALAVAGCEVAGMTFALMTAHLPVGRAPDEVLAGWQQAVLANMRADAGSVQRSDFRPAGGLALPHAQRLSAQGRRADDRAVAMAATWSARAGATGGAELLHAVVFADRMPTDAAQAFFDGIAWP